MNKIYCLPAFMILSLFVISVGVRAQGTRLYYENRAIAGETQDNQSVNYLLLHEIYAGTVLPDNYVMGKITAIRGGVGGWNRKWTVEVNTSSAYDGNRGSIISYNEPASLVTLTLGGTSYLAVSIQKSSTLYNFSFTGYAQRETLVIVYTSDVTNVQPFTGLDPIVIQGNVGIGTTNPQTKLAVDGTISAKKLTVTQSGWADFVFDEEYQLPSLKATEEYINTHKHLPQIPSASVIEKDGQDVGEMNKLLLQKVEELTLYLIKQDKQLEMMKSEMELMKKRTK